MKEYNEYKESIDRALQKIFKDYEATAGLRDLKEEIGANLFESIQNMTTQGLSGEEALRQALDKLGDITEVADQVSRQKRQEIIGGAFVRSIPLDKVHIIGYPAAGLVLALGILLCVIVYFSAGLKESIPSLMPFAIISLCTLVFLVLTQETKTHYAMTKKRSLLYTAASALILFGLFVGAVVLFTHTIVTPEGLTAHPEVFDTARIFKNISIISALGSLIPFVLPGAAMLALLVLSEKDRKKPWVHQVETAQTSSDPRFGFIAGALWIFAVALFCILSAAIGIRYAWISFMVALGVQLLIMSRFIQKKE
ncbi:MAG: permease prefix domain 1-containing protein [Treponema sp.]|jgi:hypothetical protein|nr:permease prefix domain 1-containing protein [Treponema sp.]